MEQSFEVGRHVFGVRTNSAAFAAWLGNTFSEFRCSEELGALYSVLIADVGDGGPGRRFHLVYKGSSVLVRTFDLAELARTLRIEFESYLFADWEDGIYADATLVTSHGAAALLANRDLVDLRGISRQVERAGVTVPTAGRVAIDPETGRLIPIPLRLRLPAEAVEELTQLAPPDGKFRPGRPAEAGRETGRRSGIDVVLVIEPSGSDKVLSPVSRALAVQRLVSAVVNRHVLGARALVGLARLTENTSCYELGYDDSAEMLRALVAALRLHTANAEAT